LRGGDGQELQGRSDPLWRCLAHVGTLDDEEVLAVLDRLLAAKRKFVLARVTRNSGSDFPHQLMNDFEITVTGSVKPHAHLHVFPTVEVRKIEVSRSGNVGNLRELIVLLRMRNGHEIIKIAGPGGCRASWNDSQKNEEPVHRAREIR